jgi:predicted RNase H-like HicB family nuclease
MNLPYREEICPDTKGIGYIGKVCAFRGCVVHAGTEEECKDLLFKAKVEWLKKAIEEGKFIPMPENF